MQEEILWRQRAKTMWLKGDLKTTYFHKVANGILRHNNISSISHNNEILIDQHDLNIYFPNYYKGIFGMIEFDRIHLDWQNLYHGEN